MGTGWAELWYLAWNEAWVICAYVVLRPGLSVTLPCALTVELESSPSTLSFGCTFCLLSGTSGSSFLPVFANSLRPMFEKVRPAKDISKSLPGGPTAWDARLDMGMRTRCFCHRS